jgi:hypothetical protein
MQEEKDTGFYPVVISNARRERYWILSRGIGDLPITPNPR